MVIVLYACKLVLLSAVIILVVLRLKRTWGQWTLCAVYVTMEVVTLAWAILGSVWMQDSDCEDGTR